MQGDSEEKTILFPLSGHGRFDMVSYEAYLSGNLQPYELPQQKIQESLTRLKNM
jgi:tryptophan synthase beta chain